MGSFNPRRTLSGLFFVIPEHLASVHAVVLAFTMNKQTNKHSELYIKRFYKLILDNVIFVCVLDVWC